MKNMISERMYGKVGQVKTLKMDDIKNVYFDTLGYILF